MAKITIINEGVSFEMPDGGRLMDYATENSAMLFGCGGGRCGTCICTIMKGVENLRERGHDEWLYLQKIGASPNQRLACMIWVKRGEVTLEY